MGSMLTNLKKIMCSCCSNGVKLRSSCCSNDEVIKIEVDIEPNQQNDTNTQIKCFGCSVIRSSQIHPI